MKEFTFYWLNGSRSKSKGWSVEAAFSKLGYGMGALRVLDFFAEGEHDEYVYDKEKHTWVLAQGAVK